MSRTHHTQQEEHSLLYKILTHLMLVGATFFWGLNPMVMKVGLRELDPLPFNALRLLIGVLLLFPILLLTKSWTPIKKSDIPLFFVVSVFGFFIFQFGYSIGVDATSASVSAIILGILPIMVALISWTFRIETLTRRMVLGILATFIGVILIALGDNAGLNLHKTYLWGVALLVFSELGYGVYTVFIKPLTHRYSIYQVIFVVMLVATGLFAAYSIPRYGLQIFSSLSPVTWASAAFSGFFALLLGNTLWSMGVKRLGSTSASVYGNLTPVFGVLAGMLILGERLSLMQLAGAAIILTGVTLVNRRVRG